jgi:uncharacterized protein YjbI with pentapeptide repeats
MNWSGEDFSACNLRSSNLSRCKFNDANFLDADLWDVDFTDSDLSGALNLQPAQLAGTNLTRARLPDELSEFEVLDSVK